MANVANLTTSFAMESTNFVSGATTARNALKQLTNQLDPAGKAQATFNRQMQQAKALLDAGTISTEKYALFTSNAEKKLQTFIQRQQMGVATSGQMRAGMQQLSYQLGDVSTMWALGAKPMQIFASQAGQTIQAIQLMSGEAKGLMGLLRGPWGIAITAAATVAATLAGQLFASKDAGQAAKEGYNAAADGAEHLADVLERVNSLNGKIAQQDVFDLQQQIVKKQADLANIGKDIEGTRGSSRIFNPLGVAERTIDTRDLNARKDELKTLQDSLFMAQRKLDVQNRINSAQDHYDASRSRSSGSGRAMAQADNDNAKAAKAAADAEATRLQVIDSLQGKYDPAAAAVRDYTDALKQIANVKLDPETAARYADAARKAFEQARAGMFNLPSVEGFRADADAADKASQDAARAAKIMEDKLQRQREDNVRSLAGLYQDLFTGGTKALWRDFEQMGFHVLAELLAKQTAGSAGGLFTSLGKLLGLSGLSSTVAPAGTFSIPGVGSSIPYIVPGFADGGSFQFGGRSGIDKNILSLNGSPIAKVSKGETATIGTGRGGGGGPVVHQTFDMRGAIMTDQLMAAVNARAAGAATAAVNENNKTQAKRATRRLGR